MDKYKIEKNTVQETLVIPLYGRRLCSQRGSPGCFRMKAPGRIDYDFSELEKQSGGLMQVFGALEVAKRQNDLAWEVRDYLKCHCWPSFSFYPEGKQAQKDIISLLRFRARL